MKTTRILGFVAGLLAVAALIALGIGVILGMSKWGFILLMVGTGVMVAALVLGIAHFLLRIKFRNPYFRRRGPQDFLRAGRIMVWAWGVSMIAMGVLMAVYLGPIIISLLFR